MSIKTFFDILTISMFIKEPTYNHNSQSPYDEKEDRGITFRHLSDIVFMQKFTSIALLAEPCKAVRNCLEISGTYLLASVCIQRCPVLRDDRCDRRVHLALRS